MWTPKDLVILHEIQKPVAVIVAGVYEDPHRQVILITRNQQLACACNIKCCCCSVGGLQDFSKVVFQNVSCKKKFGLPRPRAEFSQIMKSLTEEDRQKRRNWLMKMTAVRYLVALMH